MNIPVILGPTAIGKTEMALKLSQYLPIEIISLDSVLIYKDLNIGSGKPSSLDLESVPHHMIDIVEPIENFDVDRFCTITKSVTADIIARENIPVIVGGTMMYFNAMQRGLVNIPKVPIEYRLELTNDIEKYGSLKLYKKLYDLDKVWAEKINSNDCQRIIRGIEVFLYTGKPLSEWQNSTNKIYPYNLNPVRLVPTCRQWLRDRIKSRFLLMLREGLLDEVDVILQKYNIKKPVQSLKSVGYRQAMAYLEKKIDFKTFKEQSIFATNHLAKKQLTWLRKISGNVIAITSKNSTMTIKKLVEHCKNTKRCYSEN